MKPPKALILIEKSTMKRVSVSLNCSEAKLLNWLLKHPKYDILRPNSQLSSDTRTSMFCFYCLLLQIFCSLGINLSAFFIRYSLKFICGFIFSRRSDASYAQLSFYDQVSFYVVHGWSNFNFLYLRYVIQLHFNYFCEVLKHSFCIYL